MTLEKCNKKIVLYPDTYFLTKRMSFDSIKEEINEDIIDMFNKGADIDFIKIHINSGNFKKSIMKLAYKYMPDWMRIDEPDSTCLFLISALSSEDYVYKNVLSSEIALYLDECLIYVLREVIEPINKSNKFFEIKEYCAYLSTLSSYIYDSISNIKDSLFYDDVVKKVKKLLEGYNEIICVINLKEKTIEIKDKYAVCNDIVASLNAKRCS